MDLGYVNSKVKFSNMSTWDDSLYWACFHGSKHQALVLANQNNVNYVDPDFDDTPLHQACIWHGWLDVVKLFIEKYGCDPNVKTKSNESLLHYACQYGSIDIVKYLINEKHLNPLLTDNINQLETLDYALHYNQTDTAVYLCQHCISSDEMLNPNRIKTTINLIKYIFRNNPWPFVASLRVSENMANPLDPRWKTADGDNILQLVGSSKTCISHMPTAVVWEIFYYGIAKFNPDWKTADDDNLLELACQSETFLSNISSALILEWLGDATFNKVRKSIPDSKTADGDTLIHLVCQSETCISHISTAVLSEWLSCTALITPKWKPDWRTADDDNLLEVACQSETFLSKTSSALILEWLGDATINKVRKSIPDSKTADGETLIQLVCQSEMYISHISTAVLSKWLSDTTLIQNVANMITSKWKTANGDTLFQLVLQSSMPRSRISLRVLLKLLNESRAIPVTQMKMVDPYWKTLDGTYFLYALCQSNIEDKKVIELMQYYILENNWNPDSDYLDSDHEGNTALHIACQANKLALVSYLIDQAHCDPNIENKKGSLPLDMTTNLEVIKYLCQHDRVAVYSKTIME